MLGEKVITGGSCPAGGSRVHPISAMKRLSRIDPFPKIKLLIIMDEGAGNAWLIRAVEQELPLQAVIRPDWQSPNPARPATGTRQQPSLKSTLSDLARRARQRYFQLLDRRFERRLGEALFPGSPLPSPTAPVWTVPSWAMNGAETRDRIRCLAPDLMIVCGAPLLKPAIYEIPRLGTVNLHFGISPDYRGIHTLLWPWQCGDYIHIGATLHYINAGIDTGPVLSRVYPALEPTDDLVSAEAKIVRLVGRALRDFIVWLAASGLDRPAPGKRFTDKGRLIRDSDRTLLSDLDLFIRSLVRPRPARLPERVEILYTG